MSRYKLPILILVSLFILLFIHLGGISNNWYVLIKHLDSVNHFIGGFAVGLTALWLLKRPKWVIPATLIIGILWELFEAYFDIASWPVGTKMYIFDTTKDVILDCAGAAVALLLGWLSARGLKEEVAVNQPK